MPLKLRRNQRVPYPILRGISGVLTPGRMCLLLGPPGAGKSTLLKTLAGKLQHDSTLQVGRSRVQGVEHAVAGFQCLGCADGVQQRDYSLQWPQCSTMRHLVLEQFLACCSRLANNWQQDTTTIQHQHAVQWQHGCGSLCVHLPVFVHDPRSTAMSHTTAANLRSSSASAPLAMSAR